MRARRLFLPFLFFSGCALVGTRLDLSADEWQPINQDELRMTGLAEAPGAPAVYLYRQVDRDDTINREYNYVRIKILTEEGRKFANVEIPFFKGNEDINSIRARTIRPDGSVMNVEGKPFEQTIVKAKGVKVLAKMITLPDVQVGSIIEYHFNRQLQEHYVFDSHWILNEELFTRRAKFSLKPNGVFPVRWIWKGLPPGAPTPKDDGGSIRLEATNLPAFQTDDYMPPENELKARVDFIYGENDEKEPEKFWKKEGKTQFAHVDSFLNKRKAMEQAVSQIVSPTDTPEVKLQKIYARVQQVRNTGYEAEKTEQEKKRDKEKAVNNVEDIWKRGYANGREITWLYLALVRAAGMEAYPVLVSRRNEYFFNSNALDPHRLDDNVVLVKLDGRELFFDPGTAFVPFGMLPWPETAVRGLRLDKDGGSWVSTTVPDSSASRIVRKGNLKLTSEGTLEGKITVSFLGLEAISRRIEMRNEDETARKKFMEDQIKEFVPVGIDVELTSKPDWSSSSPELKAEFDLKVQGWASAAGRRAFIPVGLFSAPEKHVFEHAARVHPIYFNFPTARVDDITIELPLDWKVSSLPPGHTDAGKVCAYNTTAENKQGTLHLTRTLMIETVMLETKYYSALRDFFQVVRTGDEQQIVLQPGSTSATH